MSCKAADAAMNGPAAAGIRPEALAQAFAVTGARAVYCQPTFQNPTGALLSAERRAQELLPR
jgi:DNA-binding transcriptional MocR family regulator